MRLPTAIVLTRVTPLCARQGYCYLRHVFDNYDSLANVTAFAQAGIGGHGGPGKLYRQLLYLSTHDLMHGYRHMSGCGDIRSASGCPQLCELNGTLGPVWELIFGEQLGDMDLPIIYATGALRAWVCVARVGVRVGVRVCVCACVRVYVCLCVCARARACNCV